MATEGAPCFGLGRFDGWACLRTGKRHRQRHRQTDIDTHVDMHIIIIHGSAHADTHAHTRMLPPPVPTFGFDHTCVFLYHTNAPAVLNPVPTGESTKSIPYRSVHAPTSRCTRV